MYGNYALGDAGTVPLNVLCVTSRGGPSNPLPLLATITNPRMVVPAQEPVFDSTDPFFVANPTRTYLVQPTYYTISSSPKEIPNLPLYGQSVPLVSSSRPSITPTRGPSCASWRSAGFRSSWPASCR